MTPFRLTAAVVLVGFFSCFGQAQEFNDNLRYAEFEFRRAVEARNDEVVARQHFRNAADGFSWWDPPPNSGLCRIAGTCWLLAGDVARAIYYFHIGLQYDAGDDKLVRALEYARTRVTYA